MRRHNGTSASTPAGGRPPPPRRPAGAGKLIPATDQSLSRVVLLALYRRRTCLRFTLLLNPPAGRIEMKMTSLTATALTLLVLAGLPPALAQTDWQVVKTFQIRGRSGEDTPELPVRPNPVF